MDEQFQDQEELTWRVVAGVFLAKISKKCEITGTGIAMVRYKSQWWKIEVMPTTWERIK